MLRLPRLLWQLSRGYRLRPWRSPYLRWRMETYWGLHAERITFTDFWRFVWRRRRDLWRYLRWAARMGGGKRPHNHSTVTASSLGS